MTVPTDVGNLELDVGKGKYEDSTGGASKSKTAKVIKEMAEEHTTFAHIFTTPNGIAATKLVTDVTVIIHHQCMGNGVASH